MNTKLINMISYFNELTKKSACLKRTTQNETHTIRCCKSNSEEQYA